MTLLAAFALTSCNLDLFPETDYNEGNVQTSGEGSTESQYSTREDMEGLRNAIYQDWTKDIRNAVRTTLTAVTPELEN